MKVKTKCLKKLQKRRLFINTVQLKSATKIVRRVAPPSCNKSFCLLTRLANKTFVADFNASFENAMTIRKGFFALAPGRREIKSKRTPYLSPLQRCSEKGNIALIVVAAIAAKKSLSQ